MLYKFLPSMKFSGIIGNKKKKENKNIVWSNMGRTELHTVEDIYVSVV